MVVHNSNSFSLRIEGCTEFVQLKFTNNFNNETRKKVTALLVLSLVNNY